MNPSESSSLASAIGNSLMSGKNQPGLATPIFSAPQVKGASTVNTGATTGSSPSVAAGSGGSTPAANPDAAQIQTLLGHASNLVDSINGMYNTIYGQGGSYGTGLQNAENTIQEGYVPQFQQVSEQSGQLGNQLSNMLAARGIGQSSYAGTQEQNLAQNAQNENAGITASYQKDMNNLATSAAKQKATDQANQSAMNSQLGLYQQTAPNDTTGSAIYQLGNYISGLMNTTQPGLAADAAGNQSASALNNSLQTQAPSQIYNPATLQSQINSINQSTLPTYLQNQLQSGAIAQNTTNPGDANYWLNYVKNLQPSA